MGIEERIKKWVSIFILLALQLIVLLLLILLTGLLFERMNLNDYSGMLSFFGAIIGGSITLIGVRLTIKANEKIRIQDYYPKRISHLERAISFLTDVEKEFEVLTAVEGFNAVRRKKLFNYDSNYNPGKTSLFTRLTHEHLDTLKEDLTFVDSHAYRLYIELKTKVDYLYNKLIWDVDLELHKFRENLVEFILEQGGDGLNKLLIYYELDENQRKALQEIEDKYYKKEREYLFLLSELYIDVAFQLEYHHIELIKKLDY